MLREVEIQYVNSFDHITTFLPIATLSDFRKCKQLDIRDKSVSAAEMIMYVYWMGKE